ncbi:c-type cytochrome biogenesis protein CcsB, partial [bacterium]|nr:c-type cytochrome biogenesis protein CcsB [bacterium]
MKTILILSLIFYCASSIGYILNLKKNKDSIQKLSLYSTLIGFILHLTFFISRWIDAGFFPVSNLFESLSFFALLIAVFYILL